MVEKAQAFVTHHDPLRGGSLKRTRILSTTMVPRTHNSALVIGKCEKASDAGIGGAGVKPTAPAVDGHTRFLNWPKITMQADFVDRYAEFAVVAKLCLQS